MADIIIVLILIVIASFCDQTDKETYAVGKVLAVAADRVL